MLLRNASSLRTTRHYNPDVRTLDMIMSLTYKEGGLEPPQDKAQSTALVSLMRFQMPVMSGTVRHTNTLQGRP
jgi:hypothetical protein